MVPTTTTRITANITAYSAMSWPSSFFQSWDTRIDIAPPTRRITSGGTLKGEKDLVKPKKGFILPRIFILGLFWKARTGLGNL
jgi:hypothetical protein